MKMTNTIRVILADDHAMIRHGIRRILEKNTNIRIIGETGTGMGAIRLVHELKPDVLLLDIEMPDLKVYEVARQLRMSHCDVLILALSTCDDDHFIAETLRSGVDGYLNKSIAPAKIRDAVYRLFERHEPFVIASLLVMVLPKLAWAFALYQAFDPIHSAPLDINFL